MKSLLKLNHWQVFLLIYGIPLMTLLVPSQTLVSPPFKIVIAVVYVYYLLMIFSWPLLIGLEFYKKVPPSITLSKRNVILHFVCICILAIPLSVTNWLHPEWIRQYTVIYAIIMCYFLVAAFIVVRFASKVFASVELGREAKMSEYAGYIFALWFSFMGVWFVQPKIRTLMNQTSIAA